MTLSLFCLANWQAAVNLAHAHRIDGVRLLDEDVLAGLDAAAKINGMDTSPRRR